MPLHTAKYIILVTCLFCLPVQKLSAQPTATDTILLGGIEENGTIYPLIYMQEIEVVDQMPRKWRRKRAKYDKLKYNIYKVYPYALVAADILKDVDSVLLALGDDKKAKRKYLDKIEDQLKAEFKGEISDMTISQGHVLVKLIDRQTGKSCYNIVKELKGGVPAVLYQSIGLIFSHNLKKEYDGEDEDRAMEEIVREMEEVYKYQYEYRLQQSRLKISRNTKS